MFRDSWITIHSSIKSISLLMVVTSPIAYETLKKNSFKKFKSNENYKKKLCRFTINKRAQWGDKPLKRKKEYRWLISAWLPF